MSVGQPWRPLLEQARHLEQQKQLQAALQAYQQALKAFPRVGEVQAQLGLFWARQGRFMEALPFLQRADGGLEDRALELQVLESLGTALLELGRVKDAQRVVARLRQKDGERPFAYLLSALTAEAMSAREEALGFYQEALKRIDASTALTQVSYIWHNIGNIHHQMGRFDEADRAYAQARAHQPGLLETQLNQRLIESGKSSWPQQIQLITRFLVEFPEHADRMNLICRLGALYKICDAPAFSLRVLLLAWGLEPWNLMVYQSLGRTALRYERYREAGQCFLLASGLSTPESWPQAQAFSTGEIREILQSSVNAYLKLDVPPADWTLLRPCLLGPDVQAALPQLEPETELEKLSGLQLQALSDLGRVLEQIEGPEKTYQRQRRWLKSKNYPGLALFQAQLGLELEHYREPLETLRALLKTELATDEQRNVWFHMGALQDKLKEPEAAFAAWQKANQLKQKNFDSVAHAQEIEAYMRSFTPAALKADAAAEPGGGDNLIFIVGLPRSGSTLVEQILASHSQVSAGGELFYLYAMTQQWNPQLSEDFIAGFPPEKRQQLRAQYQHNLARLGLKRPRITDKMPDNYRLLGWIQFLFPKAKIIHCVRHPLDVCLSCFSIDFEHLHYTQKLEDLAWVYTHYRRLMQYWENNLSLDMHTLYYEDLVENFEPELRQLLRFCELDWEPACLAFHTQTRTVTTASRRQVQKPLYRSAVGRHRAYLPFLAPFASRIELPERYR